MIDTHCHLDMEQFDADREDVIKRAEVRGLEAIVTVGSDLRGALAAIELARKHPFIYAAIGIHPHDAHGFSDIVYADLKKWSEDKKVVAIGETGLDYHYDHSPQNVQREVFGRHLQLAGEVGLPVIVHSREADADTLAILKEFGTTRGVLHCFSGTWESAEEAMSMGLYISVAGPVTFRKSVRLREIVRMIPDDYLLAETDAPYLSPEPFRGRRNEPAYLEYTLKRIAEIRGISFEDIVRITSLNAKRLFTIGVIPERAEIAYSIRDSLYLNVTNRCTNACSFCVKFRSDFVKGHMLRLDHEPTVEEIENAIGDPSAYREVVFCGYGEPLQRLEVVKEVSAWIKLNNGRVRINTNGHANMIYRRDVLPELEGLVDVISVSLDAQDAATYDRICKPLYPNAYQEVIAFIKRAKEVIPEVHVTVVELEGVDTEKCRKLAEGLGVKFRLRKYDVVG